MHPLRPIVERYFGTLIERPSAYYSEIGEEVLWTADAKTPQGTTFRITFLFGGSEPKVEHAYVMADFWFDIPGFSTMGKAFPAVEGAALKGSVYTSETHIKRLRELLDSHMAPLADTEIARYPKRA